MSERDWEQLERLFAGKIGKDVYTSTTFQGAVESEPAYLTACFGLYPSLPRLRLFGTAGGTGGAADMMSDIARYAVSDDQASRDQTQVLALRPSAQGDVDLNSVLLKLAQDATEPLGLPTAFFTHLVLADGGATKIVFWYPREVPARWALRQFQAALAQDT